MGGKTSLMNESAVQLIQWIRENRNIDGIPVSLLGQIEMALSSANRKSSSRFIKNRELSLPSMVTVSLTNACTLRCKYCYASAGDRSVIFLDLNIFSLALDIIFSNAKMLDQKVCKVHYLGNGESTYNWPLFIKSVKMARAKSDEYGLPLLMHVTTNGIFGDNERSYLAKHIDSITLSIDGLSKHQNALRPLPNGKPSWKIVITTARYFFKNHQKWGFRITVTDKNVHDISDIIKFLSSSFPGIPIRFEPMHYCGRSLDTDVQGPEHNVFIEEYLKGKTFAEQYGNPVSYSGVRALAQFENDSFCGIATPNFCLKEDGSIVACFSGMDNAYTYGYYNTHSNKFVVDEQKIKKLRTLSVKYSEKCQSCFARLHCLGDCPSIRITSSRSDISEQYKRGIGRCSLNKSIVLAHILMALQIPINTQDILKGGEISCAETYGG